MYKYFAKWHVECEVEEMSICHWRMGREVAGIAVQQLQSTEVAITVNQSGKFQSNFSQLMLEFG